MISLPAGVPHRGLPARMPLASAMGEEARAPSFPLPSGKLWLCRVQKRLSSKFSR